MAAAPRMQSWKGPTPSWPPHQKQSIAREPTLPGLPALAPPPRCHSPPNVERPWQPDTPPPNPGPTGPTPPPPLTAPILIEERPYRGTTAGDVVRRYHRGPMLGKGGFAKVYSVREIPLTGPVPDESEDDTVYACKIVDKDTVLRRGARQKLQSEVSIHAGLQHRNVVKFERCFEDEHCVYILLELCPNRTLMELLRSRRRLTEPEARFYAAQILSALYYMHHQRLVIHRDIKLGNLFLGDSLNLKIGDFGLAAQLEDNKERKKTICGTPNYIAPEVLSSGAHGGGHSFEVDIWSVGVVLFTLLVGKPPFETDSVKHTYQKIQATTYSWPTGVPVSACAKNLIETILTARPERRPTLTAIRNHPFFSSDRYWIHSMPMYTLDRRPDLADGGGSFQHRQKGPLPQTLRQPLAMPPVQPKSTAGRAVLQAIQRFEQEMKTEPHAKSKTGPTALVDDFGQKVSIHADPDDPKTIHDTPVLQTPQSNAASIDSATSSLTSICTEGDSDECDGVVLQRLQEAIAISLRELAETENQELLLTPVTQPEAPQSEWTIESGGPWVCKWIEYSSKYGLGYQMCDGRFGVYFNDATKLVREGENDLCYLDRKKNAQGQISDRPVRFPKENRPEDLSKKVVLLGLFSDFLAGYLSKGQEEPLQDPCFEPTVGPVYVKRWMRTRHAIVFRLSNRTVQVVFCDKSEIIISCEAMLLTYRSKSGRRGTYPVRSLPALPGLSKRLRYTNDVISQMISSP